MVTILIISFIFAISFLVTEWCVVLCKLSTNEYSTRKELLKDLKPFCFTYRFMRNTINKIKELEV